MNDTSHDWRDVSDGLPPGAPGISARWTSSAKCGVGTALARGSRVWFTLSHGILNEVYYPYLNLLLTPVRKFGIC